MKAILVINAGSSSIKFAVHNRENPLKLLFQGTISSILGTPTLTAYDGSDAVITKQQLSASGHMAAITALKEWIDSHDAGLQINAIGHRIVHGGQAYTQPIVITNEVLEGLEKLVPLAPLHQPYNIAAVKAMQGLFPHATQVACFDTAFHSTQTALARQYPLPRKWTEAGIVRYGFHGLSYEYIASVLPEYAGKDANGRVVVAHLGNGASMCAMHKRQSVASTMGFTAVEGLMMGTRTGSIDPGIILYLQQSCNMNVQDIGHLLYNESGLLGVSGISNSMRVLEENTAPEAHEAIDLFCYRASQELGALAASLQGLDMLVFTAGIGENSALTRKNICERSAWLGITLDEEANTRHASCISTPESKVKLYVVPTNEELMIAQHVVAVV